jgi:hypothetical protein
MPPKPIVLTDDQVREVETLAALLNQDQIADYFGIARSTFRQIRERDEEVQLRYKRGKAKAIAHVANGLLQKARSGDTTSMIFYLKTQAGWRETARLEHAGASAESLTQLLAQVAGAPCDAAGSDSAADTGDGAHCLPAPSEDEDAAS